MEKKDKRTLIEEKVEKICENFSNIEFKAEGLGALEFEKEVYTKNFKLEKIPFRIERVAIQIIDKIEKMEELKGTVETLKSFVAFPVEARDISYFAYDYLAMREILELIAEFQDKPFFFTKGAGGTEEKASS